MLPNLFLLHQSGKRGPSYSPGRFAAYLKDDLVLKLFGFYVILLEIFLQQN